MDGLSLFYVKEVITSDTRDLYEDSSKPTAVKKFVFRKENGTDLTVACFIKDKDNFKLINKGDL
jgi:hypothetical protein